MANSNNVAKKLKDEIDSGFELFREYKKVSDKFVSDMNKEINKIGLKLDKNTSLTERKKKVMEHLEDLDKDIKRIGDKHFDNISKRDFFSPPLNVDPEGIKKELFKKYTNTLDIIKNMISYEKSFIKYKKEQRAKKTKILRNIHKLQNSLSEDNSSDKEFNKIYSKKLKIGTKTYTLKHLLGHLEAGEITDSVNDMNVNTYKALQLFLNRQEKLVNKIKLKRESQKDKKNIFRETEKLFNIKQAIIKMYELVLKGANIPTKIEGVIIILDQQKLKGKEGEKYKELKENYKKIVKEIKRLKKESKVSNVPESSSSNKASNDDSDTSSDDNGNSNNGFQEPKSQKKQRERELKRKRENLEAAKKEIEKLNIKLKAFQNQIDKNLEVFINDIENFYKAGKKFTGLDKASLVETEGNKSFVLVDGLNALLALTGQSKKVQEWINEFNNKQEDLNNLIGEIIEEIEQKDLEIARFTL